MGSPGAMTLFRTDKPQDHVSLAKHLTAEVKTEEFVAGKGTVVKWERLRRQNHWFDALYKACAAAHSQGVKLVEEVLPPPKQPWHPKPEEMAQNVPWDWNWDDWRSMRERYNSWRG
jgi:hypothetical protein